MSLLHYRCTYIGLMLWVNSQRSVFSVKRSSQYSNSFSRREDFFVGFPEVVALYEYSTRCRRSVRKDTYYTECFTKIYYLRYLSR